MSTELVTRDPAAIAEQVAIAGDLSKLNADQRMAYYGEVCKSLGLNPLTKPFQYIELDGKLVLYAARDCTDQLRQIRRISIKIASRERMGNVYIVTASATTPDGRTDESTGVVSLAKEGGQWKTNEKSGKRYFAGDGTYQDLSGDALANALMKAETKAKRRVTLSICGLGWMDESELETVPQARIVNPDEAPAPQADTTELQTRVKALRQAEVSYIGFGPAFSWKPSTGSKPLVAEIGRARRALAEFAGIPEWDSDGALDAYEDSYLTACAAEARAVIDGQQE